MVAKTKPTQAHMNRISAASLQHGAMEHSAVPCDLDDVRRYRLGRIRQALARRDLAGIVLYDQVNTRYATDATNMQIWSTHNEVRYVYVPAEGPVRLFELGGDGLFGEGLPTVDEIRPSIPFLYSLAGERQAEKAKAWAGGSGCGHSGEQRRQPAHRHRPGCASRCRRDAAPGLLDR